MNTNTLAVSTDDALHLIADQRRRLILTSLSENERSGISIDELATRISESEISSQDEPRRRLERQKIRLCHNHLPKLEEYGMITWDQHRNEVSRGPEFGTIEPVLRLLQGRSDELPTGYLAEAE